MPRFFRGWTINKAQYCFSSEFLQTKVLHEFFPLSSICVPCSQDDNLRRIAELAGRIIAHRRLTVKLISWQCLFLPCSPSSPGRAVFHFSLAQPPHHSRKHVTNELDVIRMPIVSLQRWFRRPGIRSAHRTEHMETPTPLNVIPRPVRGRCGQNESTEFTTKRYRSLLQFRRIRLISFYIPFNFTIRPVFVKRRCDDLIQSRWNILRAIRRYQTINICFNYFFPNWKNYAKFIYYILLAVEQWRFTVWLNTD